MGIPDYLSCLLRNLYVGQETTIRTKHGTMDWVKIGTEYNEAVYFHLSINVYEDTSSKSWAGWITSLNQDFQEKHQPQICRWYHSNGIKWRRTKEPLDEGKRGEWKSGLRFNIQKMKIMASGPITSWQVDGEKWKWWQILFSWAPRSLRMVTAAIKLKYICSLEEKLWQT